MYKSLINNNFNKLAELSRLNNNKKYSYILKWHINNLVYDCLDYFLSREDRFFIDKKSISFESLVSVYCITLDCYTFNDFIESIKLNAKQRIKDFKNK